MKIKLTLFTLFFNIAIFSQTNLDYQLNEFYNGSVYESTFKTQYQYDENHHLIALNHLSWDGQDEVYTKDAKTTYSYDNNGNRIESLLYYWDGYQYILDEKETFTYNANNNLLVKNVFDYTGVVFEPSSKIEFTYNAENKLSQFISYSWNGNSFYIDEKNTATFNANGILDYFINEVGSEVSPLQLYSKEVFIHNSDGKITERIYYLWDDINEEFIPDNKKTYQLNANNNLLSSLEYEYDGEFIPLYKYEYIYDFTQLQSDFTDPFNLSNIAFSYLTDIVDFFYLQDYPFYNKVLEKNILEYDDIDEIFIPASRYRYHYNENTANTTDFNQNILKIYPNPTADKLFVKTKHATKITSLKLYDSTGCIVLQTTASVVNLKNLDTGIYTLVITDSNTNNFRKKIIKI